MGFGFQSECWDGRAPVWDGRVTEFPLSVCTAYDGYSIDVDGLSGVMYTLRLLSEFSEKVPVAKPWLALQANDLRNRIGGLRIRSLVPVFLSLFRVFVELTGITYAALDRRNVWGIDIFPR